MMWNTLFPRERDLYNLGDECTNITGSWKVVSGTKNNNNIVLNDIGNGNSYTETFNAVDVMGYSKLCMFYDCISSSYSLKYAGFLGIYSESGLVYMVSDAPKGVHNGGLLELDISAYQEQYYIRAQTYYSGIRIYRIWLE